MKELDDLMASLSPKEAPRKRAEPEQLTEGNSGDMEILRLIDNLEAQKRAWVGDVTGASKALHEAVECALDKANVQDEADRISLKKKVWPRATAGTVADLRDRLQKLTEDFSAAVQK